MRYFKATVEYDGTDFAGFQYQHEARTVQGVLEAAIALRTGQKLRLVGAGRTDAGVHALGQVVSFGCETRIPLEKMAVALNSALPPDLTIRHVEETGSEFSARFSGLVPIVRVPDPEQEHALGCNAPVQRAVYRAAGCRRNAGGREPAAWRAGFRLLHQ